MAIVVSIDVSVPFMAISVTYMAGCRKHCLHGLHWHLPCKIFEKYFLFSFQATFFIKHRQSYHIKFTTLIGIQHRAYNTNIIAWHEQSKNDVYNAIGPLGAKINRFEIFEKSKQTVLYTGACVQEPVYKTFSSYTTALIHRRQRSSLHQRRYRPGEVDFSWPDCRCRATIIPSQSVPRFSFKAPPVLFDSKIITTFFPCLGI